MSIILLIIVIAVLVIAVLGMGPATDKAMRDYWARACSGLLWRRRFPRASKTDIRRSSLSSLRLSVSRSRAGFASARMTE